MSDTAPTDTEDKEMTKDDIIAFLRENPDFLTENPDAAELLIPTRARPKKGDVANFQSYMIDRLKSDKDEITDGYKDIVETSRANMNNQARIHEAVLRLLEAKRLDDFIHTMTIDLAALLDVDIAVFLVEAEGEQIPHIGTTGIRMVPGGTVDKWMEGQTTRLQDNISGIEPIYGGGAALVKSQILLRIDISMDTPPAILAFGSRNPNMFQEGQSTDQILFLARVIERCFRSWMNVSA